jgi:DNA repair exonuclease SbcCD ATPase subunit
MRLRAIRLRHARRFGEGGIALEGLSDGLNLLARPNEFGKSTLLDALRLALFEPLTTQNKTWQGMQPVDGGGPFTAELDFSADGRELRLRKVMAGRKAASTCQIIDPSTGRLLSEGEEAEQEIADLIRVAGAAADPSRLLWLSQGDGLSARLGPEEGATVRNLLSDEVTALAGGDELRRVKAQVLEKLGELETKAGKPRGLLKAALEERERLIEVRDGAEQDIRKTARLRRELLDAQEQQVRLSDPGREDEQQSRIRAAEEALRAAERASEEAEKAQRRLQTAMVRETEAARALSKYDQDLAALEEADRELGHTERKLAETTEDAGHTSRRWEQVRSRIAEAEAAHLAAKKRLAAKQHYLAATAADRRRGTLEKALSRLDDLSAEEAALVAEARKPALDEAAMDELERNLFLAEDRRRARLPDLEVVSGSAVLDGELVSEGQTVPVAGKGAIEVGTTVLRLHLPKQDENESEERAAREALKRFLDDFGAADPQEARAIHRHREEARSQQRSLKARIEEIAPEGRAALERELAALPDAETAQDPDPGADIQSLAKAVSEAEREHASLTDEATRLQDMKARHAEAVASIRADLRIIAERRGRLVEALGPETGRGDRRAGLARSLGEAERERRENEDAANASKARLDQLDYAKAEFGRLQRAARQRRNEEATLRERISHLRGQLEASYEDNAEERAVAAAGALARAEEEIIHWERERRALILLRDLITAQEEARRTHLVAPVLKQAQPMLDRIFGRADIRFDDDLSPQALERDGETLNVERLSSGTQEQISIITRLAYARLVAEQGKPFPVIFDDPVVYADDLRRGRLFDLLNEAAKVTQIIIFTCHEDAFRELGAEPVRVEGFPPA